MKRTLIATVALAKDQSYMTHVQNPFRPSAMFLSRSPATKADEPNPSILCVSCRSKNIVEKRTAWLFGLWKRRYFTCVECGATFQQAGAA